MQQARLRPLVAVVGGGFTGAAVAYHLAAALRPHEAGIVVAEPREALGAGLAYSATDPAHRINVPAARMSLLPDAPSHFADWLAGSGALRADPAALDAIGRAFPQRAVFGRYVGEHLAPLLAEGRIMHIRSRVETIRRTPHGFSLSFEGGAPLATDIVVLAPTHPAPAIPAPLRAIAGTLGFVADVYGAGALDAIARHDEVLIVGNGLTAADTIAALDARGHRGPILALSRRGLRSRGHAQAAADPRGDFSSVPARSALLLLRAIRAELADAQAHGASWHGVFDALREQGGAIWDALPPAERARLVRHLRVFWDVHRFRVAPQVEAVIERRIAEGTLTVAAGSVRDAVTRKGRFEVGIRLRGAGDAATRIFDAVAITTGPAHTAAIAQNLALKSLCAQDLLRPDPLGLGLGTTADGLAIGARGGIVPRLYVAGPLARAAVGELMGLPEVARHAATVAHQVAGLLAAPRRLAG